MQVKRNDSLYPTITLDCLIFSAPAVVLAGYILLAGLIALNVQSPLRVGLAVILAVFGSGSSTVAALFPRPGSLDFAERAALSACLSLAIGGILGFALARSLWGLRLQPLLIATGAYNLICWGLTWLRRRRLSREERVILLHTGKLFPPRAPGAANSLITVVLAVCLAAGIWVFARGLNQPALDPPKYVGLDVHRAAGGIVGQKKAGRWLLERVFKPGAREDWAGHVRTATGEPLNPKYFVRAVS